MLELEVLRERLIKCAKALWRESDLEPKTEGQQICSIPASQRRPASSLASAETLKETYQHLFTFQAPRAIQSRSSDASAAESEPIQTFILLVLALFNNAMRCWTDVRNCTMAYVSATFTEVFFQIQRHERLLRQNGSRKLTLSLRSFAKRSYWTT